MPRLFVKFITGNHFYSLVAVTFILFYLLNTQAYAQQRITPEHIADIKAVTSAVISQDGSYIAYTKSIPADPVVENRPNQAHLYLLETATGESRRYYSSSSVSSVAFRPGHESITFLTRKETHHTQSLYEVPLHGGEASEIYSFPTNILNYKWAGDGNQLAFTALEQLPEPEYSLPYSPDIYEENIPQRPSYIVNLRQSDSEPRQIEIEGTIYLMEWSPNDGRLAISVAPTPTIDDFYMNQQVFVVDSQTGETITGIENEGKIGQIEWSPDGSLLALRAGQDIHDPIDGRILIVSSEGGAPEIIDRDFEGKYEQISWTSDDTIHFIASEGVWRSYGSIRPDGSDKQYVIEPGALILTSFQPAGNGTTLFTANTEAHQNEIFLLDAQENQPLRLTVSNPWLENLELGHQELVTYTARDGEFEIEGILIYPPDYTEGELIPVIAQIHGGPEAHYSNGWLTDYSTPGQMAAAKGYGVFYPNYRGSTGRGIEFVYSSQGDAGGREFDDIVDGIDYLIEQGIADKERIGVTGGSYGGYASGWMSTYYSDRFAASVMFVGVSNNISKWGTSDIPDELYLVHARERIWENNWMKYLERSPVYWVDRAETPILILHGSEDTRVHPAQSMELYRHLKVRKPDLPLRLVYYPEEGHGNANSTSRYDYSLRMLRWFDTYLMTGNSDAEIPPRETGTEN